MRVKSSITKMRLEKSKVHAAACLGTRLFRWAFSWPVALGCVLAVIVAELAVLALGAAGKMQAAERAALEAARAQLAAAKLNMERTPEESRPQRGVSSVSAPAREKEPEEKDVDAVLRPRSLQQILQEEAESDPTDDASPTTAVEFASAEDNDARVEAEAEEAGNAEFERLVKKARAAMIEGDMRLCVLCLEEASTIHDDHPALLYFFGMAYEKLLNVDKAREYYTKLFTMRDKAGPFFEKAAMRLKNGFETPMAMRGKMSFGPAQVRRRYDPADGERVVLVLPVLLADGQEIRPEDLQILVQFFDIVNGQHIALTRSEKPVHRWLKERPDWADGEELLEVAYHMPVLNNEELAAYGELKYYGYTAKLIYKDEPLDCLSCPSPLILVEQQLRNHAALDSSEGDLLIPDETLPPLEEPLPAS